MSGYVQSPMHNTYNGESPTIHDVSPTVGGQAYSATSPHAPTTPYSMYHGSQSPEVVRDDQCFPEVVPVGMKPEYHSGWHNNNPQPMNINTMSPSQHSSPHAHSATPATTTALSESHGPASTKGDANPVVTQEKMVVTPEEKQRKKPTLWCLYGIIIALVVLLIISALVGGVVGSNAVKDAENACALAATASPTPTSTSSEPPTGTETSSPSRTSSVPEASQTFTVPTRGFVALDCPGIDGTAMPVELAETYDFELTCGASFGRGSNSDIITIISYSLFHCLQACASYNQMSGRNVCVGAEFDSDLSTAFTFAGNCFLSNGTRTSTAINEEPTRVAGVLKL